MRFPLPKIITRHRRLPLTVAGDVDVPVRAASAGGSAEHRPVTDTPQAVTGPPRRLPTNRLDAHHTIHHALLLVGWTEQEATQIVTCADLGAAPQGWRAQPDPGWLCMSTEPRPGYMCTLLAGHQGDHVAHDATDRVLAHWSAA